ncbi:hypothetical protein FCE95_11005 [Luteimonas gilva]|uniref:Discoidin domain-containing protein n=1 Tax=Luteimonas gilva TaxID=2572684 RepID=A0A4U5JPX5_9GAMM|nr:hypothetical protein [Luteimonas gilva]TKR30631.1 hypothetical protein FCE95_11005 [Luteimonas gilva]
MKRALLALAVAAPLALTACKKQAEDAAPAAAPETAAADANAAAPAAAPAAPAAATSEADAERAAQQAKLDYATMEDGYINDAKAQWATSAKASSSYGYDAAPAADDHGSYTPWQATGPVNGETWSNKNQNVGFDWLEAGFDKPVSATEVRIALETGHGVEGITKIELIDTDGNAHAVWSGLSDSKQDERGPRTWIVRKFEPTAYQAKGAKITFANNVENDYSYIDAVQLVGN